MSYFDQNEILCPYCGELLEDCICDESRGMDDEDDEQ